MQPHMGHVSQGLGWLLRSTHRCLHLQIFPGQAAERRWAKPSSSGLISLKWHLPGAFQ